MKYLFFDTETTGVPIERIDPVDHPEFWPHIVQIAWILCEGETEIIEEKIHYIYPDGYSIPKRASEIHGITTEMALEKGIPIREALELFNKAIESSDLVIGHNIAFDRDVVTAEYSRLGVYSLIQDKDNFCTMKSTTDFCKIPKSSNNYEYKWPKLSELYETLFQSSFEDAHDALADVKACMRCFFELKKRGIISESLSKNFTTKTNGSNIFSPSSDTKKSKIVQIKHQATEFEDCDSSLDNLTELFWESIKAIQNAHMNEIYEMESKFKNLLNIKNFELGLKNIELNHYINELFFRIFDLISKHPESLESEDELDIVPNNVFELIHSRQAILERELEITSHNFKSLKSEVENQLTGNSRILCELQSKILSMEKEKETIIKEYSIQIESTKKEMANIIATQLVQISKLNAEKEYLSKNYSEIQTKMNTEILMMKNHIDLNKREIDRLQDEILIRNSALINMNNQLLRLQ